MRGTNVATVTISAGSSIQHAIDTQPAGTTFLLDSGTWHQQQIAPKDNDSFIGAADGSTALTGDDTTHQLADNGGGNLGTGVLLQNITVEHYVPGSSQGAVSGVVGWNLDNDTFQYMGNDGSGAMLGHDSIITGGQYVYNAGTGIGGWHADNVVIQGAEIAYNAASSAADIDAGGIKFSESNNVQILNNYVHDNHGGGIWGDGHDTNFLIDSNTSVNNTGDGIRWEISDGATISNNTVSGNGGAGITIASSGDAEVYNNNVTVPDQAYGLLWQSVDRSDQVDGQNIHVYDNTVTLLGPNGYDGYYNYGGIVGDGNYFSDNNYYVASGADPYWVWDQVYTDDFNMYLAATGQGGFASYF
jgi:parallel beta-helix repeat protein